MILQSTEPIKKLDYILLFFFMGISSIPILVGDEFLIVGFLVTFYIFNLKKLKFDKFIFTYTGVFLSILLLQSLRDGFLEISPIIGLILKIFYAYFTIRVIGNKFPLVFINLIYFFAIISLFFYGLTILLPSVITPLLDFFHQKLQILQLHDVERKHIIIYTYGQDYAIRSYSDFNNVFTNRNSGPFWEPGGFGIFLLIAFIFNSLISKKIFTKKNIILLITIITTLSTGAYIILMIYLAFYLFHSYSSKYRYIILLSAIFLANTVFQKTYFLKDKLQYTMDVTGTGDVKYAPRTRIGSAFIDLNDFLGNPIIGKGYFISNRHSDFEDEVLKYRNNGTTNMLVEYGIIGFFFFFFTMYRSFRNYCYSLKVDPKFSFIFVLCIMGYAFSQMILIKTFFIGLSFMFNYINQGPSKIFFLSKRKKRNL